jgi:O-antigen/teichoic acid export membrane protein
VKVAKRDSPPGVTSVEPQPPQTAPVTASGSSTYGQILKSSVLVGGSTVFNVAIGIVRTKAFALLLGPSGFGLMGLYTSILNFAQSIASMGISNSGVRQIAAAVGSEETNRIARTASALRRASVALGLIGAFLLIALARPVSKLTFDSYERAGPIALLSLAVLFRVASDGQGALLQGLRRISDIVRIAVLSGLFGAIFSIVLVYLFRERGVVPSLIAMVAVSFLFSWWYSRRIGFEIPALSAFQVRQETAALLKLGFAFMASGMLMMGAAYTVRIIIMRQIGLEAAGIYQAAWMVGGLYVGIILGAMGTDFYPRLTTVIEDRAECNRLVNEQAEISLLLAGPGVIATLTFAPLVVPLFYSAAFYQAVGLLRWLCLGATLQVITWPMGFIIVAGARQWIFLVVELLYVIVYVVSAWLCVNYLGLNGAGVAFLWSYIFHGVMIYPVVRWLTGFRWSARNRQLGVLYLFVITLVFCGFYVLPPWLATTVGGLALVANTWYSMRRVVRLVSPDRLPHFVRRLVAWMELSAPNSN